jgi:hypothetical protein
MNRKMRAKLNNATAKARKERKPCPLADKLIDMSDQRTCDSCGSELVPVFVIPLEDHEHGTLH